MCWNSLDITCQRCTNWDRTLTTILVLNVCIIPYAVCRFLLVNSYLKTPARKYEASEKRHDDQENDFRLYLLTPWSDLHQIYMRLHLKPKHDDQHGCFCGWNKYGNGTKNWVACISFYKMSCSKADDLFFSRRLNQHGASSAYNKCDKAFCCLVFHLKLHQYVS